MSRSSKEEVFVREFVMGLGFLGGLFLKVGVDPEGEVIKALISVLPISPFIAQLLAGLITIALTLTSIYGAYSLGGTLGLFIVGVAFISGLIISSSPEIGAFLLIFVILLAKFAVKEGS
ncbi:hypothetical protein ES706_04494 [subsurface metagenome]